MSRFDVFVCVVLMTAVVSILVAEEEGNPAFWICFIILCFLFRVMVGWKAWNS